MQIKLDNLGSRTKVIIDTEILQTNLGFAFKADPVATPGIFTFTYLFHFDGDTASYTSKGEVTDYIKGGAIVFDVGNLLADKGSLAKITGIEKIIAAQVLVALGMIGVDRAGFNRDIDFAGGNIGGIVADAAAKGSAARPCSAARITTAQDATRCSQPARSPPSGLSVNSTGNSTRLNSIGPCPLAVVMR
ncbi:hypothetical protein GCM10027297_28220 [Parahaliea aestuarii]